MKNQQRFDASTHYAVQGIPRAANTDHITRKFLNISYADQSEAQKLDIYLPDNDDGPFPVIMALHGGAFMGGDKADVQVMPMLNGLTRGYAVVAVNYRLSWEALFPALVYDAKAAVRWIRANAQQYHLDSERIAAWGGSAGGYLSLMLGVSAGIPELEDLSMGNSDQPSHVLAVVDWFGPTNFLKMDEQLIANGLAPDPSMEHNGANSPESLLLGAKITEIPDKVRLASHETYLRESAAPTLIQHGNKDATVPVQQSIEFAAEMKKVVGEEHVLLELIDDAQHGDPLFETQENVNRVLDFLDQHLRPLD